MLHKLLKTCLKYYHIKDFLMYLLYKNINVIIYCLFIITLLPMGCALTSTSIPESTPTSIPESTPTSIPESKEIIIKAEFKEEINLFLSLDVPEGYILEKLIVDKYDGKDEIAFFGIQKSGTYTAGDDITKMISWGHFGPNSNDILYYSDNLEYKNKVKVTLDAGSYSIRFAQNNYKDAKYKLIGKLISLRN